MLNIEQRGMTGRTERRRDQRKRRKRERGGIKEACEDDVGERKKKE